MRISLFPPLRCAGGVLSRSVSHPDVAAVPQHLWSRQLIGGTDMCLIAEPLAVLLCNL